MAGLLDMFGSSWDDPKTLPLLAAAAAMTQQRGMPGLLAGLQQYTGGLAQAKEAERRKRLEEEDRAMRMQVQQLQFEDAARRRAAEQAAAARGSRDEEVLRRIFSPVTGSTANAATGIAGPRPEAAAAIGQVPQFDPRRVLAMGGSFDALGQALKVNDALNPAPKLMSVAPGASVLDERNPRSGALFTAPEKVPDLPSAVREYQFAQQQGYKKSFQDFQLEQRRAGATNIGLPKIELKTGEGIGAQVGPILKDSRSQGEAGMRLVDSASRVLQAAESGNLFAGPTANWLLKGAQVADVLNLGGKTLQEKITNTRSVVRGMAEQAVSARAQLGGQAQISNTEQELLTKATSGDISELTAGEIVQIARLNDRLGRSLHSAHQRNVGVLRQKPELQGLVPFYELPDLPAGVSAGPKRKVYNPKTGLVEEVGG